MQETDLILIAISAIFIIASNFSEAYGFQFRIIGVQKGLAGLGYSLHVRFATIARIGTTVAYPLVGYQIDKGVSPQYVIDLIGLTTAGILILFLVVHTNDNHIVSEKLFDAYLKRNKIVKKDLAYAQADPKLFAKKIMIWGFASNYIVNLGIYSAFLAALAYPDYRATILQSSAVATGFGTLLSVTYFDPKVSTAIDHGASHKKIMPLIYYSRGLSHIAVFMTTVFYYIIFL